MHNPRFSPARAIALAPFLLLLLLTTALSGCTPDPVRVQVDDMPALEVTTWSERTAGEILAEVGVALGPDDTVNIPLDTPAEPGLTIQVSRARSVQIFANGTVHTLAVTSKRPADWLDAAGITLYEGDQLLSHEGQVNPLIDSSTQAVWVKQPVNITIQVDGRSLTQHSYAPTVGQAVWEAGIALLQADEMTPDSRAPLQDGMTIVIRKARPVSIQLTGHTITILSAATQVGDVLGQAGLGLQGQDYSLPAENEAIPEDGVIKVVRVEEEVVLAQTPLPFEVKYQPDSETLLDGQRVIQSGSYGIEAQRTRIRYEDGAEVGRTVEEKWLMVPPQDQIVGYGTKIEVQTAVVDGITLEYYRAVVMYATSYSPCRSGGTRCYPNTSSGKKVTKGVVAVLLSWYLNMQGQGVYIPGYGYATIEDVGGGIPGRHWIDLGYSDDDYVSWHQWLTVYFLTPIPADVMAILP